MAREDPPITRHILDDHPVDTMLVVVLDFGECGISHEVITVVARGERHTCLPGLIP